MKKKSITNTDHERLTRLMDLVSLKSKMPEAVEVLYRQLSVARMVPPENISSSVVTMNSRVRLKQLANGREIELTVTYPDDADHLKRKVSVLSPIGIALLGQRAGDKVSWKVPGGKGLFEITEVIYQPEAEGDYSL